MKLQKKFLMVFLSISIIPMVIFSFYTYQRYISLVNQQTEQISDNLMTVTSTQANDVIRTLNHMLEALYLPGLEHMSVIDDLKKYTDSSSETNSYDIYTSNEIVMKYTYQSYFYNYDYINGIFIFTPNGTTLNYGNSGEIRSDYLPLNDEWYQQTVASKGKTYIYGPCAKDFLFGSSESISFCTALYDPYDREFLGVLFIDCSPEIFDLSSVNPLPEIAVLSVSNEDEILYTNQNLVPDNIHSQDTSEILEYEVPLELDGLKLHASIDREQLYREFGITRITIIYLAVTFILISVLISVILSKSLTKPITFLSEQMLAGEEAFDISATPYFNYKNEIGTLYNSYQEMLDEKNMYIKNELENKLILLDSQMKSLESQVNAHFLYNTLESINSIATVQKVPSISTMALALGSMFRYSIKTKSELVLLSDELKHVQDYTSIQEIRFDHRFSVQTNISEDLMQLRVLKLILQPLVENALYHGLNYCKTGNLITISASLDNSNLCILVRDNGVGMNVEELEHQQKLLAEKPEFTELGQRREEGIGIKNIHTRIRLYYGKHYGLKLDSQLGNGTTVQILVPVIH